MKKINDFSCNWKKKLWDDEEIKFGEIYHAPFMIADDSYNLYYKKLYAENGLPSFTVIKL